MDSPKIDWEKVNGLVPAIIQDATTLQVLMLGYMNEAALKKTISSRKVTFYSRTKQRLWTKGETSGDFLHLVDLRVDCDNDTLLILANPDGPTCHNGTVSCFGEHGAEGLGFLGYLEQVVYQRILSGDDSSYTVRLAKEGINRVAQKVGEEGLETALAAVSAKDPELAGEAADLIYHLIVLLQVRKLSLHDAIAVLEKRHSPKK